MLLRIATAHANSHATSCIERARKEIKQTMIGKMAIATALRGFNDLGHSVTPTFLSKNRLYLQWSTHCPKMNKNWAWEVKKISRFLSTGHRILPSLDCKVRETMVAKFELVLQGTLPVDQIHLRGPLQPYLTENISLQRSNCNILGPTVTVALLANEARFFRVGVFFGACSLQNEVGDPWFVLPFWQKKIITFQLGKFKKNLCVGAFGRERP